MINYIEFKIERYLEEVKEILRLEEWNAYLKDDSKLIRAFNNSCFVLGAFDNDKLVGYIRCVGDSEHIVLIQDLIVRKDYQKKGIGTSLFKEIENKYKDVRMLQVVTDIEDEVDNHFYELMNMKKLEKGHMVSYFK